jgi:hypothetical protein
VLPRLVALIAASAILLGLASTIAASLDEPSAPATASTAIDYNVQLEGLPTLSPDVAVTPDELSRLAGLDLLQMLGQTDAVTLQRLVTEHPEAVEAVLDSPPPAPLVAQWWAGVAPPHRHGLISAAPRLMGNLEGVPYSIRDTANREYLARTIDAFESEVQGTGGRTAQTVATTQLAMLRQIGLALGDPTSIPARSLVAVDETWPGRAVVALGDLDEADYVSYLVPGMFFTVQGQIVDWTEIALDVHRDKASIVRSAAIQASGAQPSFATVAWMGYETPDLFTVGTLDRAREGSKQLDATVAGLRAVRAAHEPHVSLITHSYGSTAASLSLARGTLDIDAIAIAGSPGVGVDSVADFGLAPGSVFVAEAAWDPVVDTAFHGVDPGGSDFGAVMMGVGGGVDDVTGETLTEATGHLGYFARGSESMRNFALIGLGLGDLVTGREGRHLLAAAG